MVACARWAAEQRPPEKQQTRHACSVSAGQRSCATDLLQVWRDGRGWLGTTTLIGVRVSPARACTRQV